MTLSYLHHEGEKRAYPVLWNDGSYSGECGCGEFIRQGDDCSINDDGETICGSCADEYRKELAHS